jgi:prolyl oligopeptidase
MIFTFLIMMMALTTIWSDTPEKDPYLWLEEVEGREALEWVEQQNQKSLDVLMNQKIFQDVYDKSLEILNSEDRIPGPDLQGNYIYNFWQDAEHIRGIWRRSPVDKYLSGSPSWETLLDMDKMSASDGTQWVFGGASGLTPDYNRFLVFLSRGGADAVVIREFDVGTKTFIEDGFYLPEAKGGASWLDINTLLVSSDFGEGSMTTSGYPRQVRKWSRGTSIDDAPVLYECDTRDMGVYGGVINKAGRQYVFIVRSLDFYNSYKYGFEGETIIRLDIPDDAKMLGILDEQILISLKSDWFVEGSLYRQGSLISLDYPALLDGRHICRLIEEPGERSSISSVTTTRNRLLVVKLNNVISEIYSYTFEGERWNGTRIDAPVMGSIYLGSTDINSDNFFFYYQNFLTPSSLYHANAMNLSTKLVQTLPAFFQGDRFKVWQYEVASADGTMIPYFVVGDKDLAYDGSNPTLLTAYGGFEIPRLPSYAAITGKSWLEKGGVYVLANIRGGGEFGPKWHQAGLKENRQRVFDDFHAVAEDLLRRKITSGKHLGIQGGSNGGLLVGVAFTQRPELYNAVVCQVPLLDMQRYNKLLAGASWMGEYGNPDIPEEWEYIGKYSPYHNLKKGKDYPEVFFTTSTRDDRVHPGHARKMVARMTDMGYPVYYFENMEGGHAGASTNEQRARTSALSFAYLHMKLFD